MPKKAKTPIEESVIVPSRLGNKIKRLRTKRGWTVYRACVNTSSVKRESLIRIESGRTDPEKVLVSTALQLIYLFWPDLHLKDFTKEMKLKRLKVVRKPDGDYHG